MVQNDRYTYMWVNDTRIQWRYYFIDIYIYLRGLVIIYIIIIINVLIIIVLVIFGITMTRMSV